MKKITVLIILLMTTTPLFAEIQFGSQFGYNFTSSKIFDKIESSKPADYKFGTGGISGGFELWYGKKYLWIGLDVFHTPQYELGYAGNMEDYLSYLILSPQFKITTKSGFYGGVNIGLANRFKNNYIRNADGQTFSSAIPSILHLIFVPASTFELYSYSKTRKFTPLYPQFSSATLIKISVT